VDHAFGIRVSESLGKLRHDSYLVQKREGNFLFNDGFERLPLEQLHDEIRNARLVAAFMQRDDVLVAETSGGADLASEPLEELRVGFGGEYFDRDGPLHIRIVAAIDAAKTAPSEFGLDRIFADPGN